MAVFETFETMQAGSECLYSLETIESALDVMNEAIHAEFAQKQPIILGVMRGALPMMGYLLPRFRFYAEVDYVHASRYQKQLNTTELQWIHEPHVSLHGRHVLLLDDILDKGLTLKAIKEKCLALGAVDVKIAVLCQKMIDDFTPAIAADFIALTVPDAYVFGYGMDCDNGWRNAPGIFAVANP